MYRDESEALLEDLAWIMGFDPVKGLEDRFQHCFGGNLRMVGRLQEVEEGEDQAI